MIKMNKQALLDALLRQNLSAFIQKTFGTISPSARYLHNWHIDAISYELERCFKGDNNRLIVTQPPRSLKSISSSVAFVAWALGHKPELQFICVSYSQALSDELARQFRLVVQSDWYQRIFPHMRIKQDRSGECITTAGGSRLATSTGGTLTGRGADIIVIDDPMKALDAASEVERKKVLDWHSETLITRLNNQKRGTIILVMQRLHEEDLAGHLLEQGGWHSLDFPAFALESTTIRIGPDLQDVINRCEGDVLHPERESALELGRLKTEMGSLAFSAQYQQQPLPLEGNLVKREWLKYYEHPPTGKDAEMTVQSWDIAGTTTDNSDWSVCTTWTVKDRKYYLIDVKRERLEFPNLRRRIIALQAEFTATAVLIERVGLGLSIIQELNTRGPQGFPKPIGITPIGDKITRLVSQSTKIEAGQVLIPHEAPWLGIFLNEILGFPHTRHDDQVDSVSQFLTWIGKRDYELPVFVMPDGGKIQNPFGQFTNYGW
jgi:predicted phage terminase large subunit-like protein